MLVITMGDPLSTNVELISAALQEVEIPESIPTVIVGSRQQCIYQLSQLGLPHWGYRNISLEELRGCAFEGTVFYDVGQGGMDDDPRQWPIEKRGKLALDSLKVCRELKPDPDLAVLTAPVNKASLVHAGFSFVGQTEYFAEIWGGDSLMLLAGPRLRVGLVTTHIPLREVADAVTPDLILRRLAALSRTLRDHFGIARPKIGVLGLNPHAGEQGLLGNEDEEVIGFACREFNKIMGKKSSTGPLPADTAFLAAIEGRYDAILAMYHDQGLGPLKTLHFDSAINITAGLKPLRVSPDHGTAADLFLAKKARPHSTNDALRFAINFLKQGLRNASI